MPKPVFCKYCHSNSHYSYACYTRRKPILTKTRIKRMGKQSANWTKTRAYWFKKHPQDSFKCYICGKMMTKEETTLDHVIPRSRAPELRHEFSNLKPCCWTCNGEKGSKVLK